jgi:hypothetical protein
MPPAIVELGSSVAGSVMEAASGRLSGSLAVFFLVRLLEAFSFYSIRGYFLLILR